MLENRDESVYLLRNVRSVYLGLFSRLVVQIRHNGIIFPIIFLDKKARRVGPLGPWMMRVDVNGNEHGSYQYEQPVACVEADGRIPSRADPVPCIHGSERGCGSKSYESF